MAKLLEKMTVEELEAELTKLREAQMEIKARKREVAAVLDGKLVALEAQRKLERLSDPEKAALLQELQAQGIRSGEDVGVPGV